MAPPRKIENWNRLYDSTIGKYLRVDPIEGHPRLVQRRNPYGYVAGRPLRWIDPDGQIAVLDSTKKNCKECGCENNWNEGFEHALGRATRPQCREWFQQFGIDIQYVLAHAPNPIVELGGIPPSPNSHGSQRGNFLKISCGTLSGTKATIADTLFHELGHWAVAQAGKPYIEIDTDPITGKSIPSDSPAGLDAQWACH